MTEPQRFQLITVVTDLWNDCEREAARWADAPEPNVPSDPVPRRHDVARAAWSRFARPSRPMRRKV